MIDLENFPTLGFGIAPGPLLVMFRTITLSLVFGRHADPDPHGLAGRKINFCFHGNTPLGVAILITCCNARKQKLRPLRKWPFDDASGLFLFIRTALYAPYCLSNHPRHGFTTVILFAGIERFEGRLDLVALDVLGLFKLSDLNIPDKDQDVVWREEANTRKFGLCYGFFNGCSQLLKALAIRANDGDKLKARCQTLLDVADLMRIIRGDANLTGDRRSPLFQRNIDAPAAEDIIL